MTMSHQTEAATVYRNLHGDHSKIANYVVERCGDFIFDSERAQFIAAFLRASADAHTEDDVSLPVPPSGITERQADSSRPDPVKCTISPIHRGEDGDGPFESTDLFLQGRGIQLLCNVLAGQSFTYSLSVDGRPIRKGAVCKPRGEQE